jgi:hypothetical protein
MPRPLLASRPTQRHHQSYFLQRWALFLSRSLLLYNAGPRPPVYLRPCREPCTSLAAHVPGNARRQADRRRPGSRKQHRNWSRALRVPRPPAARPSRSPCCLHRLSDAPLQPRQPRAVRPGLHAVTPLPSGPWPTRQTPARYLPSRSRPRVRDHAAWLVRSASPAHDQHMCAAVISAITFRVPLSLYKPRHRKSPFPSTRAPSHRRVIAALPHGSSKLPSPPPLPIHRRDTATATTHPSRTLFLVTGPPEGNAAARRRPLSLFQEVPV